MQNIRIGLDIDDTLVDFWGEYLKKFGNPKDYYTITKHVYSLKNDRNFWENLPKINDIDFIPELYCTKRINPKNYTRASLYKQGFPIRPIYQVYTQRGNKADIIKGRVDVFIDDSIFNFEQMNKSGILCLLIDSPNNQNYKTDLRIYDLKYDTILEKYNKYGKSNN